MYLTWPSSSLIFEQFTVICRSCVSSYIKMSWCIKLACQNLTSSRETSREIGTKLVKIRIQVPTSCKKSMSHEVFHSSCLLNLRYYVLSKLLYVQVAPIKAAIDANITYRQKIIKMFLLVCRIKFDVLYSPLAEFICIFV